MATTGFLPSIHGWPFGNSFRYEFDIVVDLAAIPGVPLPPGVQTVFHLKKTMGFCGGMCWTALDRFYAGDRINRDLAAPNQGEPLYDELFDSQVVSLSSVPKILWWQMRPDLQHDHGADSLGRVTQQEWPTILRAINSGQPITLTLIEHANDANPLDLTDNHRVVVYGYDIRDPRSDEWIHGESNANIRHVTLHIYDPNYPYDPRYPTWADSITLTFFTGCDDDWINIKHSEGDSVHGFFVDDQNRAFAHNDSRTVRIVSCDQTAISDRLFADHKLALEWSAPFVPYFSVSVNGVAWLSNQAAKDTYAPKEVDDKQCPTRSGQIAIDLKLPRKPVHVEVKLLRSLSASLDLDLRPGVDCRPYVHQRAASGEPGISDAKMVATDTYVANNHPTDAEVSDLDTSPYRWITSRNIPGAHPANATTLTGVTFRTLGHVTVPVVADFVYHNLKDPIQLEGSRTSIRGATTYGSPAAITGMQPQGQKLFDGFVQGQADYDADRVVRVDYTAKDATGAVAAGRADFYSRSIISDERTMWLPTFSDPARLEGLAHKLIELGLIETAKSLWTPPGPLPGPTPNIRRPRGGSGPPVFDPKVMLRKLGQHRELQGMIKAKVGSLRADLGMRKAILDAQFAAAQRQPIELSAMAPQSSEHWSVIGTEDDYVALASRTIAGQVLTQFNTDRHVIELLRGL